MGANKKYADADFYEKKLAKVMERLTVTQYDWDFNRTGGWVSFVYKGQLYKFEHTVSNARAHGINLTYGSDAFAQIVLALEDLARIVERGIYDLQNWVVGMKALPEAVVVPEYFRLLGFNRLPDNVDEVDKAYRRMAQVVHPDKGGSDVDFVNLTNAYKQARKHFGKKND